MLWTRSFYEAKFPGYQCHWKDALAWTATLPILSSSMHSISVYEHPSPQVLISLVSDSVCVCDLDAPELMAPRSFHGRGEKISAAVYGSVQRTVLD